MSSSEKNLSNYNIDSVPSGKSYKIAIIISEWNYEITYRLYKGIIKTLTKFGVKKENIHKIEVPGSFELIFGCKIAQNKNIYNAIIAVGCVVKGETMHFDFICSSVSNGIKDLNLNGKSPIIFCVLTDNNIHQSMERSGGSRGNKGVEAAIAALKMAKLNS
jgi:6,7-dimethyl-8-ribityllumazine synthase|tara:strand:- start:19 stop:501 length:483 start_codon:yes stop_codon:yes gene_type:complete